MRLRRGSHRRIRGSYEVARKLHGSREMADALLAGSGCTDRWPGTRREERAKLARRLVRVLSRMIADLPPAPEAGRC